MSTLKQLYNKGLDAIGPMPTWKTDWRWATIYCLLIYGIVLAFRMSFAGRWDQPEFWVGSERIMATHDAYFWLAKAKGVGKITGYPLAEVTRWIHSLGFDWGTIGFWAPAFMGALVSVVCALWGWLLGGLNAAIIGGLIGGLTPGFFYRSRLGYFDTDMMTSVMPLLVMLSLAYWAAPYIKRGWFVDDPEEGITHRGRTVWFAVAIGCVTHFASLWHQDILNFSVLLFFVAAGLVLVNGRSGHRVSAFYDLTIFMLAAFPGTSFGQVNMRALASLWPTALEYHNYGGDAQIGLLCAVILAFVVSLGHKRWPLIRRWYVCGLLFVAVVAYINLLGAPVSNSLTKLLSYFSPAENGAQAVVTTGPLYPSILQSIIEAKHASLDPVLVRGAFNFVIGIIAILCSLVVVVFRPVAVFLLPLIMLHVASVQLGIRFTMFGGTALMVFLSVCVTWVVSKAVGTFQRKKLLVPLIQLAIGVGGLFYCYQIYSVLPISPVLSAQHAKALQELGESSSVDSMIWTWWDWGYASQYYAGRQTMVDGGKHAGRDIYPVAAVLSGTDARRSANMVRYSSQFRSDNPFEIGYAPAKHWDTIPRESINSEMDQALEQATFPVGAPQYLVISWRDLILAKWITYFGNWNLETGSTNQASIRHFNPGQLAVNIQRGAVMSRQGGGGLVKDITLLNKGGAEVKEYYLNSLSPQLLPDTQHLIVNGITKQIVLLDRTAYRSMMTRLLIGDPNDPEVSQYFKLVVDNLPFVRIYEIIQ